MAAIAGIRIEITLAKNDLLPFPRLTPFFCGLSCFFVIKNAQPIAGRGNLFSKE
ncbi:unknown protein [Cronobacter turicensis z3032]|uniref:Uncharacterized protein n=1 Tax=Cronobacter turicensis (strain DSM 18703 / CCUG 55852 / LMG 23827 / z3032) TaxID=693216 RepID=C9XVE2_CROTZ|nr:unknown protein [Cronobacter turicensis z3032]